MPTGHSSFGQRAPVRPLFASPSPDPAATHATDLPTNRESVHMRSVKCPGVFPTMGRPEHGVREDRLVGDPCTTVGALRILTPTSLPVRSNVPSRTTIPNRDAHNSGQPSQLVALPRPLSRVTDFGLPLI